MADIIVTGGAGNIGSFIVDRLVEMGHFVIVVDNFYNGKMENITRHLETKKIVLERVDIGDREMVDYVFDKYKPGYVNHQASLMIMDSRKFPRKAIETNITGTFNIIDACVRHNVKKLVYASSASVYGNPRSVPVSEDFPFENQTLYGATKIAQEALMHSWAASHQIPFVGFRYFNIYSERQGMGAFYTQVFQKWIHGIHEEKEIIMYGDGEQTMDLVHSQDAAEANILAMFNPKVNNTHFNVGTGKETSLKQLLAIIEKRLNKKAKVKWLEEDPHLVRRRQACIEKISAELGFKPRIDVIEGVDRYVRAVIEGKGD